MFPSSPISPKRGPKIRFPSDPDRVRNRESTAKSRANRANKLNQLKELKEGLPILHEGILDTMSAIETENDIPKALDIIEQLQFVVHSIMVPFEGLM